ncbi:hypothetical protein BDFG_04392, partial [Blastomyces dermatitidis ATCC 26199]
MYPHSIERRKKNRRDMAERYLTNTIETMLLCNHISYVLRILLPTAIVLTPIENIMAITPTPNSNECLVTFENQPRISLMGAIVAYFRGALSMRRLLMAKVM